MIKIDDAGSGSFVGGTCIGVYRLETNEYYFDIIPVDLYQNDNFKKKLYLDEVVNIAAAAFQHLEVSPGEAIEVCRGYMFDKLKLWLDKNDFTWQQGQITGKAQEVVEKSFELYTMRLGLPEQYIKYTKYPFHFHKLLRWVFADFDNRIRICKVGWKCWQKIKDIKPEEFIEKANRSNLYCLKCGGKIRKGSKVRVLKYCSNREHLVFLHYICKNSTCNVLA